MNTEKRREPGRGRIENSTQPHPYSTLPNSTRPNLTQPDSTQPNLTQPHLTRVKAGKNASKPVMNSGDSLFLRQVRVDVLLFETIKNAVGSALLGENYSYLSAADFIREALREHSNGGKLKRNVEKGNRKAMSLRLNEELKNFWDSLPARERQNILERAIRTKLASGS